MKPASSKSPPISLPQKPATKITFTGDELTALARYVAAGMILLETNHPVMTKIAKGMSRLGLAAPEGLKGFHRHHRIRERTRPLESRSKPPKGSDSS